MISVIIPVYKVEKYIHTCVNSVISQDYMDLEIILVDDGSPDKCGIICDEYKSIDKRIKVIHKENGGLSDARNKGIEVATGDYITFVDSDDFLIGNILQKMVKVAVDSDADIIECKSIRCSEEANEQTICFTDSTKKILFQYCGVEAMFSLLQPNGISTTSWAKLYKRKLFDSIRFPYGKLHEDVFTTYRLVDKANRIVVVNDVGYAYRYNPKGIMGSNFSERRFDGIEGKILQKDYIISHYPQLEKLAEVNIIYACNACLWSMANSIQVGESSKKKLQEYYRKYGRSYLHSNNGLAKRTICLISMYDIHIALFAIRRRIKG